MSYVVLARKWRPKFFEEVVGQGHVARTLTNAIAQDRVAHAFLFTGARGVGKTSVARILAKALNCEGFDGPTSKPCNECASCLAITSGQSVDAFEIDGASNRGINEIRELRESVRYAPSRGRYKIYIIDEVHMLTTEAFNALLKTLEEPPPHAKFIFATTEPQKIPVTILSRCQRYDFKRIRQADIVAHLADLCVKEGIKTDRVSLQIMARQAAGGMRDAMSLLDQVISFAGTTINEELVNEILGIANRRHLFELSEAVLRHDAETALMVLDEVNSYGYDLQQFASEALRHFRDLMVVSVVKEAAVVTDLTDSEIQQARAQVEGLDGSLLHRCFGVLSSVAQEMSRSSFPKLVFEMGVLRLAHLEPLLSMDVLVDRLALLEGSFGSDLPAVEYPSASHLVSSPPQALPKPPVDVGAGADKPAPEASPAPIERAVEEPQIASPQTPEPAALPEPDPTPEPEPEAEPAEEPEPRAEPEPAAEPKPSPKPLPEPKAEKLEQAEPKVVRSAPVLELSSALPVSKEEPEPVQDPIDSIKELSPSQIAGLSPSARWQVVVETLREFNQPLAAICEHAYVECFGKEKVELAFADKYLELLRREDHVARLNRCVVALFGREFQVDLQTRKSGEDGTIAHAREETLAQTRQSLKDELLTSPAVVQAQELFDVDPEKVRVQVQLFDEPKSKEK